ncbi:hypothetical protein [Microcoleus sp. D2_18a_B4]|uniref:hypothetical protein n=1 Tax=Microcoleus sp. D2_18a_B4 TaxID=3055329 RepID=UPI002FD2CCE0
MTSFDSTENFDTNNDGQVDVVAHLADHDGDGVGHVVNAFADLNYDGTFDAVFTRNGEHTFNVGYDTNQDGNLDAYDYGNDGTIDVVTDVNNDSQINEQDVSIASAAIDALKDV